MRTKKTNRDVSVIVSVPVSKNFKSLLDAISSRTDSNLAQIGRRALKEFALSEAARAGLHKEAKEAGLELASS